MPDFFVPEDHAHVAELRREESDIDDAEPARKRRKIESELLAVQMDSALPFAQKFGSFLATQESDAFQYLMEENKEDLEVSQLLLTERYRRANVFLELGNLELAQKMFSLGTGCQWELLCTKLALGEMKDVAEEISGLCKQNIVPDYSVCLPYATYLYFQHLAYILVHLLNRNDWQKLEELLTILKVCTAFSEEGMLPRLFVANGDSKFSGVVYSLE